MNAGTQTSVHWSNINPNTRNMIMLGLALGMIVACLDGTIVSTALKTIVNDLNGNSLYAWAITAYMLCETIILPIAGKLSDIYGRKPLLITGVILFLIGSVLAGISTSMIQFIAFRAIQGLGGGMLIPVATATVADLYPPEKRGKIQGLLGAIFAIFTAIGPLLGGVITDNFGWHWCFFINVPIGIAMVALTAAKFPSVEIIEKPYIDYAGIAVLSIFIADILLLFTWAGTDFPWVSLETAAMAIVALILLAIFIKLEYRAKDPVINPAIFQKKAITSGSLMIFIFGLALMGVLTYVAMFIQAVMGYTATESGYIMLAMVAGMMITSMSSGILIVRTGYKPWLLIGPVISSAGMAMLSLLHNGSDISFLLASLFVCGFGFGCVMSVIMIMVQNNTSDKDMGMATSTVTLFRNIGSTIATGLFSTIITTTFIQKLTSIPGLEAAGLPMNTNILNESNMMQVLMQFGPDTVMQIINDYGSSITGAFLLGAVIVLLVAVVAIFLKAKPIVVNSLETQEDTVKEEKQ